MRIALTRDRSLASLWRSCRDPQAAEGAILRATDDTPRNRHISPGWHFDARDAEQAGHFVHELLTAWRDPSPACPGLKRHKDGVWAHESAVIDPRARLMGPIWIGRGVTISRDDVLIGPAIVGDHASPGAGPAFADRFAPAAMHPPASISRSRGIRERGRRLFNLVFALTALVLTAPLFPLIMLAIWLEDGRPFLFPHTRQTVGGRDFVCYKFRTMCRQAEQMKAALRRENICDGPQFHISNDPRLLRVGRILRKFHLDELPQFFNVLMGHMDVVGPRPSPDDENQFCPAWREARLSVRPGMTGLWQVSRTRAPNTDFQEWIRYDLDYVQRRSWRLDLWIIFRTVKSILMRGKRRRGPIVHRARSGDECQADALVEITSHDDAAPIVGATGIARSHDREDTYRAAA
jgi:lipopolysaccharide/colanic/teichoic acid biosynthesis glycosyltransferase